jgi:hypothetical protein
MTMQSVRVRFVGIICACSCLTLVGGLAEKPDGANFSKSKLIFECITERRHARVFEGSASNEVVYEEVGPPVVIVEGGKSSVEGSGVCRHSVWEFVRGADRITVEDLGCTDGSQPEGTIGFLRIVSGEDESHEYCMSPPQDRASELEKP